MPNYDKIPAFERDLRTEIATEANVLSDYYLDPDVVHEVMDTLHVPHEPITIVGTTDNGLGIYDPVEVKNRTFHELPVLPTGPIDEFVESDLQKIISNNRRAVSALVDIADYHSVDKAKRNSLFDKDIMLPYKGKIAAARISALGGVILAADTMADMQDTQLEELSGSFFAASLIFAYTACRRYTGRLKDARRAEQAQKSKMRNQLIEGLAGKHFVIKRRPDRVQAFTED